MPDASGVGTGVVWMRCGGACAVLALFLVLLPGQEYQLNQQCFLYQVTKGVQRDLVLLPGSGMSQDLSIFCGGEGENSNLELGLPARNKKEKIP